MGSQGTPAAPRDVGPRRWGAIAQVQVWDNPKNLRLLSLIFGLRFGDFASPIYFHPKVARQRDASSLNFYRMSPRMLSLGAQVLRSSVFCSIIFQMSRSQNFRKSRTTRRRDNHVDRTKVALTSTLPGSQPSRASHAGALEYPGYACGAWRRGCQSFGCCSDGGADGARICGPYP